MIQILGIRSFTNDKKQLVFYDAFHEKNWKAKTHKELFTDLDKYLQQIPESERWNIFYTLAHCGAGKREFKSGKLLAFDIDGMNRTEKTSIDEHIDAVLDALESTRENTTVIDSGNGLHFLIELKKAITDGKYYKDRTNKTFYKAICNKINFSLAERDLPGTADTTVFDSRRILRLPGAENKKPGKTTKMPKILFNNMVPRDIDLEKMSGVARPPTLKKGEALSKRLLAPYSKPSISHIKEQCGFIKNMYEHGTDMDEPSWYAALSIITRCADGREEAHKLSKVSPKYNESNTDIKIEQALEASGPRVCTSIANLNFGSEACLTCPRRDQIASPIQIRDVEAIQTESTGFHQVVFDGRGAARSLPCPNDLMKYYQREYAYKTIAGSRQVLKFNGKFYERVDDPTLEEFALTNYQPDVGYKPMEEFRKMACSTNGTPTDWFHDTTRGKINMKNGVLDLASGELEDHSPAYGFLHCLPYDYVKEAEAPKFQRMLEKVTGGNPNSMKIILEFIAYTLEDEGCWAQKSLMLVGDGANGKSTLAEVISALVGEESCSAFSMGMLKRPHTLSSMYGKLLNISEETQNEALRDPYMFKTLVGGGKVTDRGIYKKDMTWKNKTKLMFMCNTLPDNDDPSFGFYRRIILIPFNQTFTKADIDYDPHIDDKLKSELSGIFNMVLLALKRLKSQRGFSENEKLENVMEEYKTDQDSIYRWFKENIRILPVRDPDGGKYAKLSDLYGNYREKMTEEGEKNVEKKVKFFKRLRKHVKDYNNRVGCKKIKEDNIMVNHKVLFDVEFGNDINLQYGDYKIEGAGSGQAPKEEPKEDLSQVLDLKARNYDGINV